MARKPRGIKIDKKGRYHLRGVVGGRIGAFPLQKLANARKLLEIIRHHTAVYFCAASGFGIIGSHYHLVVLFEPFRQLSREQLMERALRLYSGTYKPYRKWKDEDWERFNRRLFSVSELMRNIQQAFTCFYNKTHGCKGSFWAGRFQSTEADDLAAITYYADLNPVRARMVNLPEKWRFCAPWMRAHGDDAWLMPLEILLGVDDPVLARKLYWASLYWTGTTSSKQTDGRIPPELAAEMERRQFPRGCLLKRHEGLSRGGKIVSWETIDSELQARFESGAHRDRRQPTPIGVGNLYSTMAG